MTDRLHKSCDNKMISGVCGGLAEYFNIDPNLVRLVFVLAAFAWGTSFLIYIILWVILPTDNTSHLSAELSDNSTNATVINKSKTINSRANLAAYILIGIGLVSLFDNLIGILEFEFLFPATLIIAGVFLIFRKK